MVWAAQYRAYGAIKRQLKVVGSDVIVEGQPDPSFMMNLRFMGQYFDAETGLHYNRHRYYDPECGQFTTQDPIGLMGGLNNYQYVPNPVSWVDPLGLCEEYPRPDFYVGPARPEATVPSTAYRYERYLNDDGSKYVWGEKMLANKEGQVTYFGFEKYDTGLQVGEAFQVKQLRHVNPLDPSDTSWSDTRLRGKFDTLQLFNSKGELQVRTPRAFGDKLDAPLETFTEAYPQYGAGGVQQLHADRALIKFDEVDILPEK